MTRLFFRYVLLLVSVCCLQSCKKDASGKILSESQMEEVLYDYHLAQGLATQSSSDSVTYLLRLYREAVFKKYSIDEATFDRSMEWYARHTERLGKIYARLGEKMGEAGKGRSFKILADGTARNLGDTLQLWHGPGTLLLDSKGTHHYQFKENADTAFRAGDQLEWRFSLEWLYREGNREVAALLALHYEGDSVVTVQRNFHTTGSQVLTTPINDLKLLKIEGMLYQKTPWTERPRLLLCKNISLTRIREHKVEATEKSDSLKIKVSPDSTSTVKLTPRQSLRDSLLRADTLREQGNHFR